MSSSDEKGDSPMYRKPSSSSSPLCSSLEGLASHVGDASSVITFIGGNELELSSFFDLLCELSASETFEDRDEHLSVLLFSHSRTFSVSFCSASWRVQATSPLIALLRPPFILAYNVDKPVESDFNVGSDFKDGTDLDLVARLNLA